MNKPLAQLARKGGSRNELTPAQDPVSGRRVVSNAARGGRSDLLTVNSSKGKNRRR